MPTKRMNDQQLRGAYVEMMLAGEMAKSKLCVECAVGCAVSVDSFIVGMQLCERAESPVYFPKLWHLLRGRVEHCVQVAKLATNDIFNHWPLALEERQGKGKGRAGKGTRDRGPLTATMLVCFGGQSQGSVGRDLGRII